MLGITNKKFCLKGTETIKILFKMKNVLLVFINKKIIVFIF